MNFPLQIGKLATPLAQNFDGVTAPALPVGLDHQRFWRAIRLEHQHHGRYRAQLCLQCGCRQHRRKRVGLAGFRHRFRLRAIALSGTIITCKTGPAAGDGGVLEISIGGNAFADILAAGGSFISGRLCGTLSSRGNPLDGRQAWTGNSGGFIDTVVQLPATAAGQTVQLKWRCGTDGGTTSPEWDIDSVSVTEVGVYDCYVPGADLAVSQTTSPPSVGVGSNITYAITVTNAGPFAASGLVLTDTIPASVTFVGASPGCTYAAGQVTASFATLNANAATNVSITVQAAAPGPITNRVSVSSATVDPNSANNTTVLVSTVLTAPSLSVTPIALDFGYVAVGQSVTQTWTIVNAGQTLLGGSATVSPPFAIAGGSPFSLSGGQTGRWQWLSVRRRTHPLIQASSLSATAATQPMQSRAWARIRRWLLSPGVQRQGWRR